MLRSSRAIATALLVISFATFATFATADIIISEIHYAPADQASPGQDMSHLEFIEIANDGPEVYDLSGFSFTRGVDFIFPQGTFIDGRGYLVVCRDQAAVRAEYGISNVAGDFDGALDNAGEVIELSNPQRVPITFVPYNDRGQWPSGAKGTGHSLSLRTIYSDPSDADNWKISDAFGGTPGRQNFNDETSFVDSVLVPNDEIWRYFKGTVNPPANWTSPAFDDSTWFQGQTGIGYGDGDDRTVLTDMEDSYLTIFCRKRFTVDDLDAIDTLVLRLSIDDGFFAYLNGTEVGSANVTGRDFDDTANSAGEPAQFDVGIAKSLLVAGENVIAVQVHNGNLGSSDLTFIPELVSRREISPSSGRDVPVEINEGHFHADAGRFVELYNDSSAAVDVSGFGLSDDFGDLRGFRIPNGTTIPGRGFLVFTEEDLGMDLAIRPGVVDRIGIALSNAAADYVVDARVFAPLLADRSEARYPDGDEGFAPAAEPTPGAANRVGVVRDVIFNEINYHPLSDRDADEFIELYNRGDVAHDIAGWCIEGVDFELPPGTVIGPGAYLVIAKSPIQIERRYGIAQSLIVQASVPGRLADSGERLRLIDLNGNTAAQLRYYDGGEWPMWADGNGSTLERIDPFGEESATTTWDASDDSSESQVREFVYTGTPAGESEFQLMLMSEGITIIDDLELTRSGNPSNLISNGTFDSNTSTWRIQGTHIRSGRTAAASERISGNASLKLICWNGSGDYKVNKLECDTAAQSGTLQVRFKARWIVGSPAFVTAGNWVAGGGAGIAQSHVLAVPSTLGTPGAINSVTLRQIARSGSANVGPGIRGVMHSPGVPEAGETVTVRARVHDVDGVASVRVFYRENNPIGAFSQTAMSGPDAEGVYTASISGRSSGTKILFYVLAQDSAGAVTRFPRDIMEATHPPVIDPATATGDQELFCIYRHDQREPSTPYHNYRFVMDDTRVAELGSRLVLSNFTLPGTFIFGSGDIYYNAKVRFAGSPWLRGSGGIYERSYTFRMPKDNPLHGRRRAFNLDEHGTDGRERVAHYLLRQNAGDTRLPYTDTHALVRFQLNNVRTGTYEDLEKPNSQYMKRWFQDSGDGAFYEMDDRFNFNDSGSRTGSSDGRLLSPPYGSTSSGSDKENYRWYFAVRHRKGADDFNPLIALAQLMDSRATPNTTFDSAVWSSVDVEEVLRTWAIEMNIDDWDTWGGRRGKNCYLYQSALDFKWRLVPWDLELTFGDTNAFAMPASYTVTYSNYFSEITRMINRPAIKRMFYGILKEQVDDFFFTGGSSPVSAWASRLSGSGVGLGNSLNFINSRAGLIRNWIRSAVSPQVRLTISTNGGDDISTEGTSIALDGQAPADIYIFAVVRNGEFLDESPPRFTISSTNMLAWSTVIPLLDGDNDIEILGFDSSGSLVDSTSIVITNEAPWEKPVIQMLEPDTAAIGERIAIRGTDFHDGLVVRFPPIVVTDVEFDEDADPGLIYVTVPDGLLGDLTPVEVENRDGQRSEPALLFIKPEGEEFIRGDANIDRVVDISDAVATLNYLFAGGPAFCIDALDSNDSGIVDLTDAVVTLSYLFQGGVAPRAPFPGPGVDPTDDTLDCERG